MDVIETTRARPLPFRHVIACLALMVGAAELHAEPAVEEVWLYGSRAMGRHHAGSDIDLTLVAPGLSHQGRLRLMGALDDLLLPWSIDLSLRHELPESLAQHVARVGRRLVPG